MEANCDEDSLRLGCEPTGSCLSSQGKLIGTISMAIDCPSRCCRRRGLGTARLHDNRCCSIGPAKKTVWYVSTGSLRPGRRETGASPSLWQHETDPLPRHKHRVLQGLKKSPKQASISITVRSKTLKQSPHPTSATSSKSPERSFSSMGPSTPIDGLNACHLHTVQTRGNTLMVRPPLAWAM